MKPASTSINNTQINKTERKILVTGVTSIHGWPVWKALKKVYPKEDLRGIRPPKMKVPKDPNVTPLCITDISGIVTFLGNFKPTHVVHCSGVCDLDVCEERPGWAHKLNVGGAKNILELFGKSAHVIFLSSDLVFSGNNPPAGGYHETMKPDPISVAGKTFAEAESLIQDCARHCIVRLGLPVGPSITGDKGGHDWIDSRFRNNRPVTLFYDEWRSCLTCDSIAEMVLRCLDKELTGLYHFGGNKPISLHELGKWVCEKGNYSEELLNGISRFHEKNGPPRIGNVALDSSKLLAEIGVSAFFKS